MLSQSAISEFQQIYKKEFGMEISYEDAEKRGEKLVNLFKIIYRPIQKEWIKEVKKKYE